MAVAKIAKKLIKQIDSKPRKKNISTKEIKQMVSKNFKMPKDLTTGKVKSFTKREVAYKNTYSMQGQGGFSVFNKATSNKKLGASNRAGRGSLKSEVKKMIKQERKAGFSQDPKWHNLEIKTRRTPAQFSAPKPKVPVKRRGK